MRNIRILDVSLVCCVVEDERVVLYGVVHPFLQFFLRYHLSRRVVGIAEVYDVNSLVGQCRSEIVFRCARHIYNVAPFAVLHYTCPAYHHVRVDIYGVNRVGDTDAVVPSYQLLNIACVALCTVVNEYLAWVEVYASWQEVVLYYCLT